MKDTIERITADLQLMPGGMSGAGRAAIMKGCAARLLALAEEIDAELRSERMFRHLLCFAADVPDTAGDAQMAAALKDKYGFEMSRRAPLRSELTAEMYAEIRREQAAAAKA